MALNPLSVDELQAAIAAKICEVIKATPALAKEDENKFARYKYVAIDQYYETFGKIAAGLGLTWVTREADFEIVTVLASSERDGGRTQEKTFARITYAFDVALAGAGILTDYSRITVLHAITGPQTAGSAASYAEKVFCRVALKAVTGEPDGDAEQPHTVHSEPNRQSIMDRPRGDQGASPSQRRGFVADDHPANRDDDRGPPQDSRGPGDHRGPDPEAEGDQQENEAERLVRRAGQDIERVSKANYPVFKEDANDWSIVAEVFRVFSPTLSIGPLQEFWRDNLAVLETMKEQDPGTYNRVLATVKKRAEELKD